MPEPFRAFSAVFPIIIKSFGTERKILLNRRQNTGYQDGKLDIAGSGHVDENETATAAAIRECKEELGITVKPENLTFVHLQHRFSTDRIYYDIYFVASDFDGNPAIMEPEKSTELLWCNVENLPSDMIECRREVLSAYGKGLYYSERREG